MLRETIAKARLANLSEIALAHAQSPDLFRKRRQRARRGGNPFPGEDPVAVIGGVEYWSAAQVARMAPLLVGELPRGPVRRSARDNDS